MANDAVTLDTESAAACHEAFGFQDINTLATQTNLSESFRLQGEFAKAEELQKSTLEGLLLVRGEKDRETLLGQYHLAMTLLDQGKLEKAEKLLKYLIEVGYDTPGAPADYLTIISGLAWTYLEQKRWTEAEKFQLHVFEVRKKIYGMDHPDTLLSMSNLAITYLNQNARLKESKKLSKDLVQRAALILDPDHPINLAIMYTLVGAISGLKEWQDAENLSREFIDLMKKFRGPVHEDTINSMHQLAIIYYWSGQREKSAEMFEQTILTRMKAGGVDDANTVVNMADMALGFHDGGDIDFAVSLMRRCITWCIQALRPEDPVSVLCHNRLKIWEVELDLTKEDAHRRSTIAKELVASRDRLQGRYPVPLQTLSSNEHLRILSRTRTFP